MIRLTVDSLEPGMVLAAPIPHPHQRGVTLLKSGHALEPKVIRELPKYGVKGVWVHHPGFDFLDDQLDNAIPTVRVKLYHTIKESFTEISEEATTSFDVSDYRSIVGEMIQELVANQAHAVWAERIMDEPDELFSHSSNVCYLSLIVGMHLVEYIASERRYVSGSTAQDLSNLGVGAMLHDLGKVGWIGKLRNAHFFQDSGDSRNYQNHPVRGYQMLQGRLEATATSVVLHHHQRYDGQGFPEQKQTHRERRPTPMAGKKIHIFPRIVSVTNAIDALMSACEQRNQPKVAALSLICSDAFRPMFDPVVLSAALRCVPPFPIGECVTLSDQRKAIVIDLNETHPCKPRVQLLGSSANTIDPTGDELDLSRPGMPTIMKQGKHKVSNYLYELPKLRGPDGELISCSTKPGKRVLLTQEGDSEAPVSVAAVTPENDDTW